MILGDREVVAALRKNPLTRALRPDKMTLTALEATLRLYLEEPRALMGIPTLRMLTRPVAELDHQARALARKMRRRFGARLQVDSGRKRRPGRGRASTPDPLAQPGPGPHRPSPGSPRNWKLACAGPATPVIGRVERGVVLLDLRTALPGDQEIIMAVLAEVLADGEPLT